MKTAHHQNFVNPTSSCMQGVTQAHTNESSYVTWRIWNRAQSSFSCQEWSQRFPWKRAQGIRTVVQLMEAKCPRCSSNIKQAGRRGWVAFVEQEERIGGQRKSDWSSRKLSSVPSSAVQYPRHKTTLAGIHMPPGGKLCHSQAIITSKEGYFPNPFEAQIQTGCMGTSVSLTACTKAGNPRLHPWNRLFSYKDLKRLVCGPSNLRPKFKQ